MEPIEPITYTASATVSTTESLVPTFGVDVFAPISALFGGYSNDGALSFLNGFLNGFWTWFTILSYLLSIILIVIYVFAAMRRNLYLGLMAQNIRDQEALYEELMLGKGQGSKLAGIIKHSSSDNPNDWKLAIIESDILLDETLKQRGYVGATLGERLRSILPNQMDTLNDAWEAHKVRNKIAHEGSDFVLTKRIAQETIARYQRVLAELGVH